MDWWWWVIGALVVLLVLPFYTYFLSKFAGAGWVAGVKFCLYHKRRGNEVNGTDN